MTKYKLVPVEPTRAMIEAGLEARAYPCGGPPVTARDHMLATFRAMIAAAPTPKITPEPES